MGGCGSTSDPRTREVDDEIASDKRSVRGEMKLLLLGAGGSGKSTFFKQLKSIHGSGFSPFEINGYKQQVHRQIIESIQTLIHQCKVIQTLSSDPDMAEDFDDAVAGIDSADADKYCIADDFDSSVRELIKLNAESAPMSTEIAEHIKSLWNDCPAIKLMFQHRNKLSIADSSAKFFDDIVRIGKDDYVPSEDDVLLVRYRTTGMTEKTFTIKGSKMRVVDVGGQRNERKKWIFHFDSVASVLFVIALSSYDEVPFEEVLDIDIDLASKNNMVESLEVFDKTVNLEVFQKTPFVLFLNKSDIMKEKILRVPISSAFPDYDGPQEYEPSVKYIREQFLALDKAEKRDIFVHVTSATDKGNVEKVFNDVQVALVNLNLNDADII
jgi:guanine nucleotide-binding protein subunit alpha